MKQCYAQLLLLFTIVVGCHQKEEPKVTSAQAQAYLDEIVGIMQRQSVHRTTIDWDVFRNKVNAKAQGAQSIADTYPAIELALTLLEDNHSFYQKTDGSFVQGSISVSCLDASPTIIPAQERIGYIKVTTFNGGGAEAVAYAQSLHNSIKAADNQDLLGWIVDLRGNLGGNMWPMLGGVGPILGEGVVGYFLDPDGKEYAWSYQQGSASAQGVPPVVVPDPYRLITSNPKVAVLTDQATASAGEAIAIAFKGRSNTRSFGRPTCGLSTANLAFTLSDGALLVLTVSIMADRNKAPYGKSVATDELLPTVTDVQKAIEWLKQ